MIPVSPLPALSHNFSNLEENFKFNDMDRNRTGVGLDVHKDK